MSTSGRVSDPDDSLFRTLFEQARESVLLAGCPDGNILEANPKALETLLCLPEQLSGHNLQELVAPSSLPAFQQLLARAGQDAQSHHFTSRLLRRDKSPFPCEGDILKANDTTFLVTFMDVSERVRAKEDIELRNIAIANVTSGVTVADARQPDLPLIYVNRGFQQVTGYSAREAIGRSCRFLQGADRDQPELDTLRRALREGQACVVQLRNYRKDGTLFYNELHISPVHNEAGELTHFVGIQLDVTDQVQARESLRRSEEQVRLALEQEKELNEIKTRFISMVSHEFRTPMTGIQASAALLRRLGDRLPAEKKARHLANIETSLRRMNRLLDDVLFFSRAESRKLTVERSPVILSNHLPELLESFAPVHPDRVIRLACEVTEGAAHFLDAHLLDHILQNLIGNALKYSEPDQEVTCTVSEDSGSLVITVEDHGIGIPPGDRHRLFEAFHRAGNVGTRQGTGLGLNIVLRAVELLGGDITFTSTENGGSTFVVRLPIITSHPDSQNEQNPPP